MWIQRIRSRRMAAAFFSVTLLSGAAVASSVTPANAASTVTLYFLDGNNHAYSCTDGKTWSVNATVTQVRNACGTRVWLHQNNNNTGESWCTSKVSASDPPEIKYANLYISSNTAAC
jgi:hypothetical protein